MYGGARRDVADQNTGGDSGWTGEFNTYLVPSSASRRSAAMQRLDVFMLLSRKVLAPT